MISKWYNDEDKTYYYDWLSDMEVKNLKTDENSKESKHDGEDKKHGQDGDSSKIGI